MQASEPSQKNDLEMESEASLIKVMIEVKIETISMG